MNTTPTRIVKHVRRFSAIAVAGLLAVLGMSGAAYAYPLPLGSDASGAATTTHPTSSSGFGLTPIVSIALIAALIAVILLVERRLLRRPVTKHA
jgi:uncharacterized RDD family membrane protein YckC